MHTEKHEENTKIMVLKNKKNKMHSTKLLIFLLIKNSCIQNNVSFLEHIEMKGRPSLLNVYLCSGEKIGAMNWVEKRNIKRLRKQEKDITLTNCVP